MNSDRNFGEKKCQQKCQQTALVGSKMELRKVGWSLLDLNHKRL
jgi:Na+-translocating ferredoxin:NAD+ oxidoreductase RNF subunit RnfB